MHYICTVYLRRLRHEIKQIKSNVFYLYFYFKVTPHIPPTVYLLQPGLTHVVHSKLPGFMPTPTMYKIKTKIKTVSSNASQTPCDITPVHTKEGPTCAPSHVIGVNPYYTY